MFEALVAASGVALCSLIGVLFFGKERGEHSIERFVIPIAVGVFLSLALYALIPEVMHEAPEWGGVAVGIGFIVSYLVAYIIHRHLHHISHEHSEKKEAAILILIGDALHNFADGIVIGGAFLIAPEVGLATAFAVALHEIPQEIVEFGVLMRAGYTRTQAVLRNLASSSTVILGTLLALLLSATVPDIVWLLSALAAGNLLYIAASELLPRLHGSLKVYGGFWPAFLCVCLGFVAMTGVVFVAHEKVGGGHSAESVEATH
jgi:zinc and cadmium transporter